MYCVRYLESGIWRLLFSRRRGSKQIQKTLDWIEGDEMELCHSGTERSGVIETIIFCMDPIESSRLSWMTECSLRSFVYRLSSFV